MSGSGMSQRGRLPQLEPLARRILRMRLLSSSRSPRRERRRVSGSSAIQSQRSPSTKTLRLSAPSVVPPKPAPIMDSAQSYRLRVDMNASPARNRSPLSPSLKSIGSSSRCNRSALVALRSSIRSGEGVRPSGRLDSSGAVLMFFRARWSWVRGSRPTLWGSTLTPGLARDQMGFGSDGAPGDSIRVHLLTGFPDNPRPRRRGDLHGGGLAENRDGWLCDPA